MAWIPRWIKPESGEESKLHMCSICKRDTLMNGFDQEELTPYCPYCGTFNGDKIKSHIVFFESPKDELEDFPRDPLCQV